MRLYLYAQKLIKYLFLFKACLIHINFQIDNLLRHMIEGPIQHGNLPVCCVILQSDLRISAAEFLHCIFQLCKRPEYGSVLVKQRYPYQKERGYYRNYYDNKKIGTTVYKIKIRDFHTDFLLIILIAREKVKQFLYSSILSAL